MSDNLVLFGAGACGRYALKFLREKGIEPYAFVDNNEAKWGTSIEGVSVFSPEEVLEFKPNSEWVATAISRPAATEIRDQMKSMGVKTKPLWECIPVHHGLPPANIRDTLFPAMGDVESQLFFNDQISFRKNPDYDYQMSPSPMSELYFPDFIKRLDDESFVDLGAASGDTVQMFLDRWHKFSNVTAFEPDRENFRRLDSAYSDPRIYCHNLAVGDADRKMWFSETGDHSARISNDGGHFLQCVTLDGFMSEGCFESVPTYVKMDIESFEPQALWGARELIKEHSPVLAVCAYHESSHLWEIPLLLHALNPEYKLYFKRYAEGAFEIVWYGVPPSRIK